MTLSNEFLSRPIAHRGYHDAVANTPENSVAAIDAAIQGDYGIELDLQMSKDGVAMVFHDPTLNRMASIKGFVAERTAEELGQITLGKSDQTIPTLSAVLDQVAGRVPLLIELKDQTDTPGGTLEALQEATAAAVDGYSGAVALMSFHPGMLTRLGDLTSGIPLGLTGMDFSLLRLPKKHSVPLSDYAAFDDLGASFISHRWQDLGQASVSRLKSQGVPILSWTIKSEADETAARAIADNITFEGYAAS